MTIGCRLFITIISLLGLALTSHQALAGDGPAIQSAAHIGFGVVGGSSTGFDRASGSLVFFDVARRLGDALDVGLRSLGEGGRTHDSEFYRMGAGPLISY